MLSPHIFRTYDIRGVTTEDFTPGSIEKIGKAYGTYLLDKGTHDCVLGHDVRASSTQYAQSFIKGLVSTGVNVHYLGTVITPTVYYARHH
ncbi:hypothetical protein KC573_01855 [candidate division WWE3 bacterium]|uniref:Alpha-D-phosphohexomutase alpha/beta/alpha domain-containing protein n=1 Tax=candidate division WWE3 bacterium TaxID=2053526 RepID=A0A955LW12_UNCKA|nr:hypothetical protein [candidate division WWE3 bacterium]